LTSESDHKYNIKLFSLLTETEVVMQRRYKFVPSNNSSLISGGFWPLLTRHKYMVKTLNDNDKNNGRQATNSPVTVRLRIVHGTKSPVTTSSTAYRIVSEYQTQASASVSTCLWLLNHYTEETAMLQLSRINS